jgi:hypothetical protein
MIRIVYHWLAAHYFYTAINHTGLAHVDSTYIIRRILHHELYRISNY